MNALAQIVQTLNDINPPQDFTITKHEFKQWIKTYSFAGLQNQSLGQYFCKHFSITDYILFFSKESDFAEDYIQSYYVN